MQTEFIKDKTSQTSKTRHHRALLSSEEKVTLLYYHKSIQSKGPPAGIPGPSIKYLTFNATD